MEATPLIEVVCGLIENDAGRVLVARRPEGKHLAGLWEFPGGKMEPGETPEIALAREIREELGCEVVIGAALSPVTHGYEKVRVRLRPFEARLAGLGETPRAREHTALAWVTEEEMRTLPMPAADEPIVAEWSERRAARAGRQAEGVR